MDKKSINLLAFETSSCYSGVALLIFSRTGSVLEYSCFEFEDSKLYSELLLIKSSFLLSKYHLRTYDLDVVAFGSGPGKFTGLRISCSQAKGIGLSLNIPVIPVGSSYALANNLSSNIRNNRIVVVATDARMGELYVSAYSFKKHHSNNDECICTVLQSPILISNSSLSNWIKHKSIIWKANIYSETDYLLAGDAWKAYSFLEIPDGWINSETYYPGVKDVAYLARNDFLNNKIVSPDIVSPLYVRNKIAFTSLEISQGMGGGNPKVGIFDYLEPLDMLMSDIDEVSKLEQKIQISPWTLGNFKDSIESGYKSYLIRNNEGIILCFCVAMVAPDAVHILRIGVDSDFRCKGLGSKLLNLCFKICNNYSLKNILLEVDESNAIAINFYKKHGFYTIGNRKGYYLSKNGKVNSALVMKKNI
ncbi:fused YeaZ/rimI ribosomal protein N-acetyltransferase [Candidatus Kinetoplastibacterium oncopeltii TCC290E]|uniref:Fused YeaZ/rimI ribosomal protein N-acetyltransferase n=1 Tax=Candidatus Kinetoplastidibacterium stringomonadis TCC290E TaxID=1208920 RepID=M1M921_9PROT|nr:bifunctional tRNA (adenosine(37)-N6)-threonylcarbamoyltransferase complex dimerization subunit type 1 TsaB/ribosomal protein alanine acetyltransferase RimI [Candidatus Kinetoplastibacterium oncopeltii]AGF48475.1 fused YeaZ/rimI ribosomal protein N-acetyltransferase [Candidatus Kinetoplastibacterium oncopeltii TCC290E]